MATSDVATSDVATSDVATSDVATSDMTRTLILTLIVMVSIWPFPYGDANHCICYGDDGRRTLMGDTNMPHHDAPKLFILGPVLRSGKASDWSHRGKSCLGSSPALGTRVLTTTLLN